MPPANDRVQAELAIILPLLHRRVLAPVPYWCWFRLPSDRRLERALARVREWFDEVSAETRDRLVRRSSSAGRASHSTFCLTHRSNAARFELRSRCALRPDLLDAALEKARDELGQRRRTSGGVEEPRPPGVLVQRGVALRQEVARHPPYAQVLRA